MNSATNARDIVLLNRPEWTRNQTTEPRSIARCVGIASDDARAENRHASKPILEPSLLSTP